jgi:pyridoxine kinase
MTKKTIIIHSKVSYGYVGSNTTSFVLQSAGHDVITVPTVLYSNHLGYATVGGGAVPSSLFESILEGILKLSVEQEIDAIITGYIGNTELVQITAAFIKKLKKLNPEIFFVCDPVMGDIVPGLYVPTDVPQAIIEQLIPLADLITPNQFEFQQITGKPAVHIDEMAQQLNQLVNTLPKQVVITGCYLSTTEKNMLDICVAETNTLYLFNSPKIPVNPPGTGELFTAHLLLSMFEGADLRSAASSSATILSTVLLKMHEESRREFDLSDLLFSLSITGR